MPITTTTGSPGSFTFRIYSSSTNTSNSGTRGGDTLPTNTEPTLTIPLSTDESEAIRVLANRLLREPTFDSMTRQWLANLASGDVDSDSIERSLSYLFMARFANRPQDLARHVEFMWGNAYRRQIANVLGQGENSHRPRCRSCNDPISIDVVCAYCAQVVDTRRNGNT